jgi:YEATS domain-containing protein 4
MPGPTGSKRVRGIQIYRPFVYGTEATPFDPANRPRDAPADHTHKWKVFVRGINNEDISYWLRKVQFKLHDTYANSVRMIESPPFEVEETGWGEFEIAIKFYFNPDSTEKPQQIWHGLKLHPYQGNVEEQKEKRTMISSVCYEEVLFNEPVENFYDLLTGGAPAKSKAKGSKGMLKAPPNAEIPERNTDKNKFSREEESKELDRLGEAVKQVEKMVKEATEEAIQKEKYLEELQATEGKPVKKR